MNTQSAASSLQEQHCRTLSIRSKYLIRISLWVLMANRVKSCWIVKHAKQSHYQQQSMHLTKPVPWQSRSTNVIWRSTGTMEAAMSLLSRTTTDRRYLIPIAELAMQLQLAAKNDGMFLTVWLHDKLIMAVRRGISRLTSSQYESQHCSRQHYWSVDVVELPFTSPCLW